MKEFTGGGIVVTASLQLLQLGTRLHLYSVCPEENQQMKLKRHFELLLFQVHMSRFVVSILLYISLFSFWSVLGLRLSYCCILVFFLENNGNMFYISSFPQEKWAKNLYIASVCYGRTVSWTTEAMMGWCYHDFALMYYLEESSHHQFPWFEKQASS